MSHPSPITPAFVVPTATTDSSLTDSYSVVSSTCSRRSEYLLQWRTSYARHRSRVPRPPWYTPLSLYSDVSSQTSSGVHDDVSESDAPMCSPLIPVLTRVPSTSDPYDPCEPDPCDPYDPCEPDPCDSYDPCDVTSEERDAQGLDHEEDVCDLDPCDRYVEVYYDRYEDALVYFDHPYEREESDLAHEEGDTQDPVGESTEGAEDLAYDEELEEGYLYEESPTYEGEDLVDDGGPVDHDLTNNSDLVDGNPTDDDLTDSDPVDGDDSDLADDYDVQ